jgi:CRISPR/Cas system CMR subunit Cmr4 (Cas7 group RAMP superfamily)
MSTETVVGAVNTNSNVISFPDLTGDTLKGAARQAALQVYRDGVASIVSDAVGKAFSEAGRLPGCGSLDIADAALLFVQAFRNEISRIGV